MIYSINKRLKTYMHLIDKSILEKKEPLEMMDNNTNKDLKLGLIMMKDRKYWLKKEPNLMLMLLEDMMEGCQLDV
jgi:hypothetical protein